MKYKKLKRLINIFADRKSKKLIAVAENRADLAEKLYLKKLEKHGNIYDAKIKYCENLRDKTEIQCQQMIAAAKIKCQELESRRRAVLVETIRQNNEVSKRLNNIKDIQEKVRGDYIDASIEAGAAEQATINAQKLTM